MLNQLVKFALVGLLNTAIDLAILNSLIITTKITSGLGFSLFKSLSFMSGVINSYFLNKHWTFGKNQSIFSGGEFAQFTLVIGIGLVVNVSVASILVNVIGPLFGLTPVLWANVAALTATATSFIWHFWGAKFIVFR